MKPEERDRIMLRIQATWPRPAIGDATAVVWAEHLTRLDYETTATAVGLLERSSARQPAISELHEAYGAARAQNPARAIAPSACVVCTDGWVEVACMVPTCALEGCTVARCPNGCMPPTRDEQEARRLAEDREWNAQRQMEREASRL